MNKLVVRPLVDELYDPHDISVGRYEIARHSLPPFYTYVLSVPALNQYTAC